MRTTHYLLGILFSIEALGVGALQTQAAEPAQARLGACNAKDAQQGMPCASAKRARSAERSTPVQVTKASLDLSVCGRLQGQVERDTCLNHVEASA